MDFSIHYLDIIPSTNEEIKSLIVKGQPEGCVVVAREQTGGYGRQGRRWSSPQGGLYFSILLRPQAHQVPPEKLPTLSLVISLAIQKAIRDHYRQTVSVKWPNDIMVGDDKLCGISLEAIDNAVCVGIGINVFRPKKTNDFPGSNIPVYIADFAENATREDVLEASLSEIKDAYLLWLTDGFEPFVETYNEANMLKNKQVEAVDRNNNLLCEGIVTIVDAAGRLWLLDRDGTEHPLTSGEVHLKRGRF